MNFKKLRQVVPIKGNGNLVLKEYKVSSFSRLHLSINGNVELYQSAEEKVNIETEENLVEFIMVVNSGKTLFIAAEAGYRRPEFTHLIVKIYFRQITQLNICCEAGDITGKNIISLGKPLEIKIQSTGKTNLELTGPAFKMTIRKEH